MTREEVHVSETYWWDWRTQEGEKRAVDANDGIRKEPWNWREIPEGGKIHLTPELPKTSAKKSGDRMVVSGEGAGTVAPDGEKLPSPPGTVCRAKQMVGNY